MKNFFLRFLLIISLLSLPSCGYSPLYKQRYYNDILTDMYAIKIPVVQGDNGKNGQILRNYLYSSLNPYGNPSDSKYSLDITLGHPIIEEKAIRQDETATFATITQRADYVLRNVQTKEVVFKSFTSSISSYNILNQAYASDLSKEDTVNQNLKIIAQDITTRIALFFKEEK
jgi:LPS-assembly lipoprotein